VFAVLKRPSYLDSSIAALTEGILGGYHKNAKMTFTVSLDRFINLQVKLLAVIAVH